MFKTIVLVVLLLAAIISIGISAVQYVANSWAVGFNDAEVTNKMIFEVIYNIVSVVCWLYVGSRIIESLEKRFKC